MLVRAIRHSLTTLGVLTAHPIAFGIVGAYAILWLIFQPHTFDWHAVAVLSTWFMTLLIQRAEHRDTQAIHAKLDELLRSMKRRGPSSASSTRKSRRRSSASGRRRRVDRGPVPCRSMIGRG
jgi:low affinity Fe/Cu permease